METLTTSLANMLAIEWQIAFARQTQLLKMIYENRLCIEHYVPAAIEKLEHQTKIPSVCVSYRHFSYPVAPLRDPVFKHEASGADAERVFSNCLVQVIEQLKKFHVGKVSSEEANNQTLSLIKSHEASAQFLWLVCKHKVALMDYVPNIRIRPDGKTGRTYYSVSYRHKHFLYREQTKRIFEFASSPETPDFTLEQCMHKVISQLREAAN
jgi:hypothetical protein